MAETRENILKRLGQQMLGQIELTLARNREEIRLLREAADRIAALEAENSVLEEERAKLIARGQSRTPENESRLMAVDSIGRVAE